MHQHDQRRTSGPRAGDCGEAGTHKEPAVGPTSLSHLRISYVRRNKKKGDFQRYMSLLCRLNVVYFPMKDPLPALSSDRALPRGPAAVSPCTSSTLRKWQPAGKPVVFLHGGPGGGSDPKQRRFFHPENIALSASTSAAAARARPTRRWRTTPPGPGGGHRETPRTTGIEHWQVFGGSWAPRWPWLRRDASGACHGVDSARHLPSASAGIECSISAAPRFFTRMPGRRTVAHSGGGTRRSSYCLLQPFDQR